MIKFPLITIGATGIASVVSAGVLSGNGFGLGVMANVDGIMDEEVLVQDTAPGTQETTVTNKASGNGESFIAGADSVEDENVQTEPASVGVPSYQIVNDVYGYEDVDEGNTAQQVPVSYNVASADTDTKKEEADIINAVLIPPDIPDEEKTTVLGACEDQDDDDTKKKRKTKPKPSGFSVIKDEPKEDDVSLRDSGEEKMPEPGCNSSEDFIFDESGKIVGYKFICTVCEEQEIVDLDRNVVSYVKGFENFISPEDMLALLVPEKPEVKEPEVKEPEKPEVKEPEVKEPEKPEVKEPEVKEPEKPEVKEPEVKEPEKPEVEEPEVKEPEKPEVEEPEDEKSEESEEKESEDEKSEAKESEKSDDDDCDDDCDDDDGSKEKDQNGSVVTDPKEGENEDPATSETKEDKNKYNKNWKLQVKCPYSLKALYDGRTKIGYMSKCYLCKSQDVLDLNYNIVYSTRKISDFKSDREVRELLRQQ